MIWNKNQTNKKKSTMIVIPLVVLVVCVAWHPAKAAPKMPQFQAPLGSSGGSYHMVTEMDLINEQERIIVEEWGSFDEGLFRLDLVKSSTSERITFLLYGQTSELFQYQPYTCSLISKIRYESSELQKVGRFLAEYQVKDNEKFKDRATIFGIGPTWIMASQAGRQGFLWVRRVALKQNVLDMYSGNISDYNINMYFTPNSYSKEADYRQLRVIDWMDKDDKVAARAVLVSYDRSLEGHSMSLFDLPEGYGCKHSKEFDHIIDSKFLLDPINIELGRHWSLDMAVSVPNADPLSHIWDTQTATVKLIAGRLSETNKYFIMETQMQTASGINKIKRIFDYTNEYHNFMYTINKTNSQCTIDKWYFDNFAPPIRFTPSFGDPVEVKLNIKSVNALFTKQEDYHLLKATGSLSEPESVLVQEKSVPSFSSFALSGPASIVRRTTIKRLGSPVKGTTNSVYLESVVTVYIMDSYARRKIRAKISLKLYEHFIIDHVYLHRQLDVSDCVDENRRAFATMRYLIESPDSGPVIEASSHDIYSRFMESLYYLVGLEPIQLTKVAISYDHYHMYVRFQLLDVPSISLRYKMIPSMAFVDKSNNVSLIIKELTPTADKCAYSCETFKCRAFSYCGTNKRCSLYIRDLVADNNEARMLDKQNIDSRKGCSLYVDNNQIIDHDMRPHHIISRVLDILKQNDYVDSDDSPSGIKAASYLTLTIVNGLTSRMPLHFTPVSIETSITDDTDLFIERNNSIMDGPNGVGNKLQDGQVVAQYTLEIEGKTFDVASLAQHVSHRVVEHMSYENCAMLCQDDNCLSFSYCEKDLRCTVTRLHKTEDLELYSKINPHCSLYRRDYLSKFEPIPNIIRPFISSGAEIADTASDCAARCMESQHVKCLSFDYCEKEGGWLKNCYLHSLHGRSKMIENNEQQVDHWGRLLQDGESSPCTHYSRSYLADFDKYLDARLQSGAPNGPTLGVDVETCAKLCIENNLCAGFSACFDPEASVKLECHLTSGQVQKSQVTRQSHCNAYLLSPRSEFNTIKRRVLPSGGPTNSEIQSEPGLTSKDDDDAESKHEDPLEPESSPTDSAHTPDSPGPAASGSWLMDLLMVLLGLKMGCAVVLAYQYRERIVQYVGSIRLPSR